jgi:hypothetical protein
MDVDSNSEAVRATPRPRHWHGNGRFSASYLTHRNNCV